MDHHQATANLFLAYDLFQVLHLATHTRGLGMSPCLMADELRGIHKSNYGRAPKSYFIMKGALGMRSSRKGTAKAGVDEQRHPLKLH